MDAHTTFTISHAAEVAELSTRDHQSYGLALPSLQMVNVSLFGVRSINTALAVTY